MSNRSPDCRRLTTQKQSRSEHRRSFRRDGVVLDQHGSENALDRTQLRNDETRSAVRDHVLANVELAKELILRLEDGADERAESDVGDVVASERHAFDGKNAAALAEQCRDERRSIISKQFSLIRQIDGGEFVPEVDGHSRQAKGRGQNKIQRKM